MYISRDIDKELILWKLSKDRKPLMIRGARQVGKSSTVRNLAKDFRFFIEINFDEQPRFSDLFAMNSSVGELCEQLSVLSNTPIVPGETLLFFDEIQSCLAAIGMLRYFYERMPELHVICAGSLLEFALAELPSFGVGRVRSVFMYPLSFSEFLGALGENHLLAMLKKASVVKPLNELVHQRLIRLYKKFLIIGGMPEAVSTYLSKGDMLEVQKVLTDLLVAIEADFTKYKFRISSIRLLEVFRAIAQQVGKKFTYSYPGSSMNNVQIKECIELLKMAGLIHVVTHSSANGIPLGAETNVKKRKYLIFDTGIFQRLMGLDISILLTGEEFDSINKGHLAELHVGLELIKSSRFYEKTELYYWQREALNSQAEVDYVCQFSSSIVPVEVKAGTKGSMQSLYLFLNEKKVEKGCRLSLENFSFLPLVDIIPLYATFLINKQKV